MKSKINPNLKVVEAQWPEGKFNGIAFVGEAPGENEALTGRPFVGSSGQLLDGLCKIANINRAASFTTNVFSERPPKNDVSFFFEKHGKVKDEWNEIPRLKHELEQVQPNIIIALGATALWALTGQDGISKYRGTVLLSTLVPGTKVLPTFHPAYVMRQWQSRSTVGRDLLKARIESQQRNLTRVNRELWINPTIDDLYEFEKRYMNCQLLSADIETSYPFNHGFRQIMCIGFAPTPDIAITVPFIDKTKRGLSYWTTAEEEVEAWEWCARHLENATVPKLGQNFMYDMQWMAARAKIRVRGPVEDTMLLHHALQPELEKGLAYMASVYTNESAFKTLVQFKKNKAGT